MNEIRKPGPPGSHLPSPTMHGCRRLTLAAPPVRRSLCYLIVLYGISTGVVAGCAGANDATTPPCDENALADLDRASEDILWRSVAQERGFAVEPGDFFAFASLACEYQLSEPRPADLAALGSKSSQIVVGTIADIVSVADSCQEAVNVHVRFVVDVQDTFKGDERSQLLINDFCGHGAKIAGLRTARPKDPLLFFLDGPWPLNPGAPVDPSEELAFGLVHRHLGIARTSADGLEFALRLGRESDALLKPFSELQDAAAAASAK